MDAAAIAAEVASFRDRLRGAGGGRVILVNVTPSAYATTVSEAEVMATTGEAPVSTELLQARVAYRRTTGQGARTASELAARVRKVATATS